MTHLEIENLASDYLEGLLGPAQKAAVDAHLTGCGACQELLADVRQAIQTCRAAEDLEPAPWLVSKILQATLGERKPTLRERIAAWLRPVFYPRVAYPIAMSVFTFSVLINAAGLNLRNLKIEDLNPRTWVDRADRQGHLMYAHAEKFYLDLRVVYEIESRFQFLNVQPPAPEQVTPNPPEPGGGTSQGAAADQTMASVSGPWVEEAAQQVRTVAAVEDPASASQPARSVNP